MDCWLDKMGMSDDTPDPARKFLMDLGTDLEPVIARMYERQTERTLFAPAAMVHPLYPMLRGNPDRIVIGEPRGVELKTENQFMDQFGDPGTDQVPYHYLVQCAHYMAICDLPVWDIALLRGGATFAIYTIERDLDLERDMNMQLTQWWEKHVVGNRPPDIDGSGAWKVYLRKKFPVDILPVKESDSDTLRLVNNLRTVRQIVNEYSLLQEEMENRLKFIIGDHEGIAGEFGKITWKKAKDIATVDWEGAFTDLAVHHATDLGIICDIEKRNLKPRPGARRFLVSLRKDWTYGDAREQAAIGEGHTDPARALSGDSGLGSGSASGSDH